MQSFGEMHAAEGQARVSLILHVSCIGLSLPAVVVVVGAPAHGTFTAWSQVPVDGLNLCPTHESNAWKAPLRQTM